MTASSKKVLVVDDEEMIRNVVVRILKIKDHDPLEADSGEAALNVIKNTPDIDYVILDLSMPGKFSGEDIFDKIRQDEPNIKIIISSGFIEPEKRKKFEDFGVSAILEKPYKMEDILSVIV